MYWALLGVGLNASLTFHLSASGALTWEQQNEPQVREEPLSKWGNMEHLMFNVSTGCV